MKFIIPIQVRINIGFGLLLRATRKDSCGSGETQFTISFAFLRKHFY